MKLLTLFILVACLQVSAKGYSQITLNENNTPLKVVFKKLQKQSGYNFLCTYQLLQQAGNVTVQLKNVTLQTAMNVILKGKALDYTILDKTVVIKEKPAAEPAQTEKVILAPTFIEIKGTVKDEQGKALVGATVKLKGTEKGTSTDASGNFLINIPSQSGILIISFVGYETIEVNASGDQIVNVSLKLKETKAEEVVVVGYGTQKKVNLTGAVSSLSGEAFENRPVKSAVDAMQGTIAGLTVQSANGQPGAFSTFRIRGQTSVNSGGALVIIDGIPGNINQVNPLDIESISVLKDAASAAIYGARAAEGVILVTTKQAKTDKMSIDYSGNYAYKNPTRLPKPSTGMRFMEMANEAAKAVNAAAPFPQAAFDAYAQGVVSIPNGAAWIFTSNTDWVDLLMKEASQQDHNITLSKASANGLKYLFSAGWRGQDGLFKKYAPDDYDQYTFRSNISVI